MSTKFKIRNGTPTHSSENLCNSCRNGRIIKGESESSAEVVCNAAYPDRVMRFKVSSCSDYDKRTDTRLSNMEDVAWILRTDPKTKGHLGFVSPEQLKKEKLKFEE